MVERDVAFGKERRKYQRFQTNFSTRLLDLASGKVRISKICDISAQGLGMIGEKIEEFTPLRIWLHFPDRKKPFATEGKVVWKKEVSPGIWRLGVALNEPEFLGLSRVFRT